MKLVSSAFLILTAAFISCTDDSGIKGSLKISVTDSPIDADNVTGVNFYVTHAEAYLNGEWTSLSGFEQPKGVNLLEYSGGKSFDLIDQFVTPGKITQLRFSLNLAALNSSLVRNPQCNVVLTDGTTQPIYFFDPTASEFIVKQDLTMVARALTDFTFDFDIRKSLVKDDHGNFIFTPVIRIIETAKAGNIAATITNDNPLDRIVVFAYTPGQFSLAETAAPPAGDVRFKNAIASGKVRHEKFGIGFLEAGNYDLVFTKNSETGEFVSVLGRQNGVSVKAGETLQMDVDLSKLTGS
jgi:hypothetical protein